VGVAEAEVRERRPVALEELFQGVRAGASEGSEAPGLWLALDCLQDPQNVGAIFRSAAFFGVRGILLTQERSVGLTSTVYDIASGGVEAVPFSVQVNLRQAFETAKAQGLWILGTSEHGRQDLFAVERDRPWLVVLGNEERGMRRLTEDRCDVICAIRPRGGLVTSLNVSVAAGIVISRMA
jgi:23S rRNA (guanosine2251-2'-O)-methyltransferase